MIIFDLFLQKKIKMIFCLDRSALVMFSPCVKNLTSTTNMTNVIAWAVLTLWAGTKVCTIYCGANDEIATAIMPSGKLASTLCPGSRNS